MRPIGVGSFIKKIRDGSEKKLFMDYIDPVMPTSQQGSRIHGVLYHQVHRVLREMMNENSIVFIDFEKAYEFFYRTAMVNALEIWRRVLKKVKKKYL